MSADTKDLDRDLEKVKRQLKDVEGYVKRLSSLSVSSFGQQATAVNKMTQSLETMKRALVQTGAAVTSSLAQVKQMTSAMSQMDGAEVTVTQRVEGGAAGGGLAAAGSIGAASSISQVGASMAQTTASAAILQSKITSLNQAAASFGSTISSFAGDLDEMLSTSDPEQMAAAFKNIKASLPNAEIKQLAAELVRLNQEYQRLEVYDMPVEEARRYEQNIERVRTELQKSVNSWQKVTSESIKANGNIGKAANSTTKLKQEADKASNSFKGMGKSILSMKNIIAAVLGGVAVRSMAKLATEAMMTSDGLKQLARIAGSEGVSAFNSWNQEVADGITKAQLMGTSMNETYKTMARFTKLAGSTEGASALMDAVIVLQGATGRTLEDIEERFRSAFTGSVEAIENVLPGMTRQMLNYQAATQFGAQSFQSLNVEQQKSIMLQAILSETMAMTGGQITGGQARVLALRASLAELRLAWGGVFAVIAEMIIPVLMKLANVLMTVAAYVKAFFQLLGFGSSSATKSVQVLSAETVRTAGGLKAGANNAATMADNLSGATKQAKKLKGALMGFDEINTLNMTETGGDTGGVGGGLAGGFGDLPDFGGGLGDLEDLGSAFDDFNAKVEDAKKKIMDFWNKFKVPIVTIAGLISSVLIGAGIAKISGAITAMWAVVGPALSAFGFAILDIITQSSLLTGIAGIFQAMGIGVTGAVVGTVAVIVAVVLAVIGAFVDLWMNVESFRQSWIDVWNNIMDLLSSVWENVLKPIFDAIVIACMIIWEEGLKPLWDAWVLIWEQISGIITDFLNFLIPIITKIVDLLGPFITPVLKFLGAAFGTMVSAVISVVTSLFRSISDIFGNIRGIFNGIINFVKNVFTGNWRGAWEAVKSIFSNIFGGLGNIIKAPINGIIGMVNTMIRGLNKIKFPDWVPLIGGKGINIPEVPRLARGGVVDSGQIYMAGEAGKEAIVPLEHNTQWAKNIGQLVAKELGGMPGQGSDKPVEVTLQVGANKLGKVVIDSINKLQSQEGRVLLNI